ncbi:TetR/AcrR family transcriptional regulator [Nitratireductor luteus]|uniref:TetR/AcrR family transcriptional regulator n=1 Tax=Nitratireductor luteus TaxID=2976980 RepID=UPI002240AA26
MDPKRERIVHEALEVFLAYGFSRTTMDDIARAVGVSRPALYLLFRNKADIFRAVGVTLLEQSRAQAEEALKEGGTLSERLIKALDRAVFRLTRLVDASPHGEELIDVEHRIAADIVAEWRECLIGLLANAIAEEAARKGADLEAADMPAGELAAMLFDLLEGMRMRGICGKGGEEAVGRMVRLIGLAVSRI